MVRVIRRRRWQVSPPPDRGRQVVQTSDTKADQLPGHVTRNNQQRRVQASYEYGGSRE